MSTPVTVAKIQTSDRALNQIQTNVTNSLQTTANLVNQVTIIGEIKIATINLDQFQRQAGTGWVACDGQSIVGSTLNKISGQLKAPVQANAFLRID